MKLIELTHHIRDMLRREGIESAVLDSQLIAGHVLGFGREDVLLNPERIVSEVVDEALLLAVRRSKCEPMAYILGYREFRSLRFEVNQAVLIPRPETELLVEKVLEVMGGLGSAPRVLELGTGSGCVAVSLAVARPKACVVATDICPNALEVAQRNSRAHGGIVEFVKADMTDMTSEGLPKILGQKFDIIVSNPPYIGKAEQRELPKDVGFEPCIALDGGEDGLMFYRAIASNAYKICNQNAWLVLEIGCGQAADVVGILKSISAQNIHISQDLAGLDRVISAQI